MAGTLITKRQLANLAIVDADVASGAAISTNKLADGANFVKRDGSVSFTADQSMGNNKLIDLAAPVNPNDAVRLIDLQNGQAGISAKDAVRVATTGNITLSGLQTIDGVSVVAGNRVLVKNQASAATNGIYIVASGAWTRSTDADTSAEVKSGMFAFVNEGTQNADSGWLLSTDGTITLGTTALNFVQFSGAGQIVAGTGMTKTGNQLDVNTASTSRIVVNADDIDLALVNPATAGNGLKIVADNYGRVTDRQNLTAGDVGAQASNTQLAAIAALASNGIIVKNGAGSAVTRSIAGTVRVGVSNGDGLAGNPTIDLLASGVTAGTYNSVTVDIYGRVTVGSTVTTLTAANFVTRETPSGSTNGVNTTFTLANVPITGTEHLFLNGVLMEPGTGNDYTISGASITMLTAPFAGDKIRVSYQKP